MKTSMKDPKSRRSLAVFLPIFLLMMLPGCAALSTKEDSLKVNLSSMQMLESTLMEQRFNVKIRVQNRNNDAIHIEGLTFDLALNGKDFASGVSNESVSIPPLSEALLSVDLTSTIFGLINQIQTMQSRKNQPFQYEFSGSFYTRDSLFGISFSEQGEIDLISEKKLEEAQGTTD